MPVETVCRLIRINRVSPQISLDIPMPRLKVESPPRVQPLAPESFDQVFDAYRAPVYRFACALTGNVHDAEDLFQETWLRAVQARRGPSGSGDVKSWLFTIAANLNRDSFRKRRVRRLFFLDRAKSMEVAAADADTGWEAGLFSGRDQASRTELGLCLGRALAGLPPRQRRVFVLKDIEGFRHQEVGRMLGIPERTVRTLLHRAVKRLRKELASFDPSGRRSAAAKEGDS